jgi:hypothetical protein
LSYEKTKKAPCSSGKYSAGTLFGTIGYFGDGFGEGIETVEKNRVQDTEWKGSRHNGRCLTFVQSV